MQSLDDLGTGRGDQNMLMAMAKQADAALAALGGFEETIKPGCQVMVGLPKYICRFMFSILKLNINSAMNSMNKLYDISGLSFAILSAENAMRCAPPAWHIDTGHEFLNFIPLLNYAEVSKLLLL